MQINVQNNEVEYWYSIFVNKNMHLVLLQFQMVLHYEIFIDTP